MHVASPALFALFGGVVVSDAFQFQSRVPFHRPQLFASDGQDDSSSERASTTRPIKGKYPTSYPDGENKASKDPPATSPEPANRPIKGKYPTSYTNGETARDPPVASPVLENSAPPAPRLEDEKLYAEVDASAKLLSTKMSILGRAASCNRGETATAATTAAMLQSVVEMESVGADGPADRDAIRGTWELVYSDTELFRSSPFFMAGRAVCEDGEEADRYDWFCSMHRKALAISTIGTVRQIVSQDRLVSEFETKAGAVPFLSDFAPFQYSGGWPVTIDGAIVSTADITPTEDGSGWEIFMDTVEIKGSNIPLLRGALDAGLNLKSRGLASVLEGTVPQYTTPRPIFETTYLDADMRISRDQDGKVFVYVKASDSQEPTDYSNIMADLGVGRLLEGLNDNFFKVFI